MRGNKRTRLDTTRQDLTGLDKTSQAKILAALEESDAAGLEEMIRRDRTRLDLARQDMTGPDETRLLRFDMNKKATIPELSADTQKLIDYLRMIKVGDIVSYNDLERLIGKDVRKKYRHLVESARAKLLNDLDARIIFGAVSGVGLKRLDDSGKVDAATRDMKSMRRAAKRGIKKIAAVDSIADLPPEKRIEALTTQSMLGAIEMATRRKTTQSVAGIVAATGATIAVEQLTKAFEDSLRLKPKADDRSA